MSIFKACDIRGIVGDQWDARDAERIGRAVGKMLRGRGPMSICVGGDFRRSTPPLKAALTQGLLQTGASIFDLGQVPTPIVYFAARHLDCPSAAIVTGSHNSGEYNGVKLLLAGQPAVPDMIDQLRRRIDAGPSQSAAGRCQSADMVPVYETWIHQPAKQLVPFSTADDGRRRDRRPMQSKTPVDGAPRIVLDAMGGAFTDIAPRVLRAAGYEVTALYQEIDPDFAGRAPNPAHDANLALLVKTVRDQSADVGVALDGDGDRVVLVDHRGRMVRPEPIAGALVTYCFERPTVVYDLKCASLVRRAVAAAGGRAVMRPSGHGFIKSTMIELGAEMGVEVSGHHFFGVLDGGDDGLFSALVVLRILQATGRRLASLVDAAAWPAITPDLRIPYNGDARQAVEEIAARCGGDMVRLDGVRVQYETGWALARASITEPMITFRFEGREPRDLRPIVLKFLAGVPRLRDQVLEKIDEQAIG